MAETPPPRLRFAPSPTGLLHIGGLRTALYNYLVARARGGAVVLRIEDTDRGRFVEGAEQDIIESLRWAGLGYDEGPDPAAPGGHRGPFAPYRQSERGERYREAAQSLVDAGYAYVAFDSQAELEAMRHRAGATENSSIAYDAATRGSMRNALNMSAEDVERAMSAGEPYVIRLKVDAGETVTFEDIVRGTVTFDSDTLDDQVLLKSDGMPTYHLANVVDDHEMEITLVVRGEEWLPSTPKHALLYRYLGWEMPQFAHLPLILSPSGGKLSKRNAESMGIPVSVRQYRDAGFEPEAVVNYLALLGWHPEDDRELFSLPELIQAFSLERVSRSGAKFDLEKLEWMNGQVLRALPDDEIAARARPTVEERVGPVDPDYLGRVAGVMRERLTHARDLADAEYFFSDPSVYDEAGVAKRWKPESARLVRDYADRLADAPAFDAASTEALLRALAESEGVGAGQLIHPVRLAVTGTTVGAGVFETLEVLGRDAVVRRLRRAAEVLGR
jgi:glutamyl-tRNA synthetase